MTKQIAVFTEEASLRANSEVSITILAQSQYAVIGRVVDATNHPIVILHRAYEMPFGVGLDKVNIIDVDDDVYNKVLEDED